jgi:E3 ubiquitin-protein ligase synoviolin
MTTRSFIKRLTAFLRYRRATHDMNKRYADATVEDIQREDTCIICREEMRPWSVTNPQVPPDAPGVPPPNRPATLNERTRPKKLPCGHILHLGCLKSWLERQQVCPTCRNPVVDSVQPRAATNNGNLPAGQAAQQPLPAQQQPLPGQLDGAGAGAAPPAPRGGRGMRMLNFGPLRLGFGQANLQDLAQGFGGPQNQNQENPVAGGARVYGLELGFPRRLQPQPQQGQAATGAAGSPTLQDHIQRIEQYIAAEIGNLRVAQQELQLVQLLQVELARLRLLQNGTTDGTTGNFQTPQAGGAISRQTAPFSTPLPHMQRHGANPDAQAIPAGSADLPPGITIPEGWSLLPLQRLDNSAVTQTGAVPASNVGLVPTATTTQTVTSPMPGTSNDIPAMTATNPDRQSQASSVDSSDTNAIHTPPSIIADQLNAATSTSTTTTLPNITSSTTPASLPLSNPSVLPNWGSSQPFSGHTPTDNTNSHAPPPNPGEDNSLIEEGHSSFFSTGTSDQGSEEYRQDKGKGRAATVEDTIDDAEGA